MTATAHSHGHAVVYAGGRWVYADTGAPAVRPRPCPRCGAMPTAEGHDACLGRLPGVTSACCGHGVEPASIIHGDEGAR